MAAILCAKYLGPSFFFLDVRHAVNTMMIAVESDGSLTSQKTRVWDFFIRRK
jgi:hypothetical protein